VCGVCGGVCVCVCVRCACVSVRASCTGFLKERLRNEEKKKIAPLSRAPGKDVEEDTKKLYGTTQDARPLRLVGCTAPLYHFLHVVSCFVVFCRVVSYAQAWWCWTGVRSTTSTTRRAWSS
jgi:hypothetical protein